MTSEELMAKLRARYVDKRYAGPPWAFLEGVRDRAGQNAGRTADAIAVGLWPSRGLEIVGFELKVSRSDWLRELRNPAKAEAFGHLVDRWWIVVSSDSIVAQGELPPTWGLMVMRKKLEVVRQAPTLPAMDPADGPFTARGREFLAAMLRTATYQAAVTPEEIVTAVSAERKHQREMARLERESDQAQLTELRQRVATFEREAGVHLGSGRWYGEHDAATVGKAVKLVLDGEATTQRLKRRLEHLADEADRVAAEARRAAGGESEDLF